MGAERPLQRRDGVLLIQFSRAPQPGQVKTRMLPHLSAEQACDLHCELTRWTCRQLLGSELGAVELSVTGDRDHPLFAECQAMGVNRVLRQRGADLGQRMYNALRCGLAVPGSIGKPLRHCRAKVFDGRRCHRWSILIDPGISRSGRPCNAASDDKSGVIHLLPPALGRGGRRRDSLRHARARCSQPVAP